MKKKIVVILFLIVVLLILAGLLSHVQKAKIEIKVEEVLPADPLFYMSLVDLQKNVEDFSNTALMAKFKQIDFQGTMKALGAKEHELAFYEMFSQQIFSKQHIDIFLTLFGQEAAVAFYLPAFSHGTGWVKDPVAFVANMSFVTRLSPELQLLEVLMGAAARGRPEITQTTEEYRGEKIYRLDIQGVNFPIVYVRFHDLLVFGISDAAAKGAVDVVRSEAPSLGQDTAFLNINQNSVDGAEITSFFHYEKFKETAKDVLLKVYAQGGEAVDEKIQQQLMKGFQGAEGIRVVYFSSRFDQISQSRLEIIYDVNKVSEYIRRKSLESLAENRSLSFVPKTVALYSWNAFLGLKFYLEHMQQPSSEKNETATAVSGQRAFFDFDMDKLLTIITDEIGWYLFGIDMSGMVPLPQGVFFVGVTDMDQAMGFMKAVIAKQGMGQLKSEKYKGIHVEYLEGIPFLERLEPACAAMNGYLLVATNRALIKQAIDTQERVEESFLHHGSLIKSEWSLRKGHNSFFFGNMSALVEECSEILRWGNQWADTQEARREAFRKGAQKRMEEVKQELANVQEEIRDFERRMEANRIEKESLTVLPEDIDQVVKELERKNRFLESAKKAVNTLREEEQQLLSVQQDETQMLTEEGIKRLAEVQEDLHKRMAREQEIQREIAELEKQHQQLKNHARKEQELAAQILTDGELLKNKMAQAEMIGGTIMELEQSLKEYDQANLPTRQHRDMVLKNLADPFLEALAQIQWIIVESGLWQDKIRSEFFIEVK